MIQNYQRLELVDDDPQRADCWISDRNSYRDFGSKSRREASRDQKLNNPPVRVKALMGRSGEVVALGEVWSQGDQDLERCHGKGRDIFRKMMKLAPTSRISTIQRHEDISRHDSKNVRIGFLIGGAVAKILCGIGQDSVQG